MPKSKSKKPKSVYTLAMKARLREKANTKSITSWRKKKAHKHATAEAAYDALHALHGPGLLAEDQTAASQVGVQGDHTRYSVADGNIVSESVGSLTYAEQLNIIFDGLIGEWIKIEVDMSETGGPINRWTGRIDQSGWVEYMNALHYQFRHDSYDQWDGEAHTMTITKGVPHTTTFERQRFAAGGLCLIGPIRTWVLERRDATALRKPSKQQRSALKKWNGVLAQAHADCAKYKDGVPEEDLSALCCTYNISIDVLSPLHVFKDRDVPALLACTSDQMRVLKRFQFVNTALDHVEPVLLDISSKPEEVHAEDLALQSQVPGALWRESSKGITRVYNKFGSYKLHDPFRELVNEWEKRQGLEGANTYVHEGTDLYSFAMNACRYLGVRDFRRTDEVFVEDEDDAELVMQHFDMTKAYASAHLCPGYQGYAATMTDWAQTDKIVGLGIYWVDHFDFSKADKRIRALRKNLGIWWRGEWCSTEIQMLERHGVVCTVTFGAWCVKAHMIDFFDDMKELIPECPHSEEGAETPPPPHGGYCTMLDKYDGVPAYSLWSGQQAMSNTGSKINVRCSGRKHAEIIRRSLDEGSATVFDRSTPVGGKDVSLQVRYPKDSHRNRCHVMAQILSYARQQMVLQLMNVDAEQIVRVVADGVYTTEKWTADQLTTVFLPKPFNADKIGKNQPLNPDQNRSYISNLSNAVYNPPSTTSSYGTAQDVHHHGPGGTGKTHTVINDEALVRVVYAAHSWKLARGKQLEKPGLNTTVHHRLFTDEDEDGSKQVCNRGGNLLIDECSMLTDGARVKMEARCPYTRRHWVGDQCQMPPHLEGAPLDVSKMMDKPYTEQHRCTCSKLQQFLADVRLQIQRGDSGMIPLQTALKKYKALGGAFMRREDVVAEYKPEDLILAYTHMYGGKDGDTMESKYPVLGDKWQCTKTTKTMSNGDVVLGPDAPAGAKRRHVYTVHCVQGQTCDNRLYVDIYKFQSTDGMKLLYTAVSRARRLDQVRIIIAAT